MISCLLKYSYNINEKLSHDTDALAAIRALYGQGEGPVLLNDVGCEGDEVSLLACSAQELGMNNCNHGEDAGVLCPGMTVEHVYMYA